MKRESLISQLSDIDKIYDFVIIGGGATGLGIALDAVTRGYSVALFEQSDFSKATSSRSTKLVHGGVRYLAQGDVGLVLEALRERGLLKKNAPHLVKDQRFLIPCYRWWEGPFYTIGLVLYDLLAGKLSLGRSFCVGPKRAIRTIPALSPQKLLAGIVYHDGQFDDSRLAINLVRSAIDAGACVVNYMQVVDLTKKEGKISGVIVQDKKTDQQFRVQARSVINATGIFADDILQMDEPDKQRTVRPSQGVHLVLDSSFLLSDHAIMIPSTSDGRVLFAVPWHNKVVVGTTDTLMKEAVEEPIALQTEIDFILDTAGRYLTRPPKRSDVLSVYAGLRPLAAPRHEGTKTKEISRSHKLIREKSGLITIIGGKWTTYRKMAEDTVNMAIRHMDIPTYDCVTANYPIHGSRPNPDFTDPLYVYGTDADLIRELENSSPEMKEKLHPNYSYTVGELLWVIRNEMPLTIEDVLARRFRILFMDARAAMEMAPKVAFLFASERGEKEDWITSQLESFHKIAANYILDKQP